MGKNDVPQANPGAMKQPGRERRRGERWRCSLYRSSSLTGGCHPSCRRTTTCPKKRPVESH